MYRTFSVERSSSFLFLSIGTITFLLLLINASFKIILWQGLIFTVSSVICPLIGGIYLLALRRCSFKEQRHLLNSSLIALYLFCIGVFILVNLPASEHMNGNPAYQIIFEDIPKKFFATTISFCLSFYIPHWLFCRPPASEFSPKQCVLLMILGSATFFCIDFYFLFSGPHDHHFQQTFIDSFMVTLLLSLIIAIIYLSFFINIKQQKKLEAESLKDEFPLHHYLIFFAVVVMLMCIACEYRIVTFGKNTILTASCIFFPITMIISTVLNELWGCRIHLKLIIALIGAQFIFDTLLMGVAALPSPNFFNLNFFYNYIIPRRVPAASLSLLITFLANSLLLFYFQQKCPFPRWLRILIANICASSLLCFVDYSLLFWGVYPYEQIINLVVNVWNYKIMTTVLFLPVVLWLCTLFENEKPFLVKKNGAI